MYESICGIISYGGGGGGTIFGGGGGGGIDAEIINQAIK